jgi:hypothetical protein
MPVIRAYPGDLTMISLFVGLAAFAPFARLRISVAALGGMVLRVRCF